MKIKVAVLSGIYETEIPFKYDWIRFGHKGDFAGFYCKEPQSKKEIFIKCIKINSL